MKPLGARDAARVRASLQSGLALWTMLRRTWAALALSARDKGHRRAAATAEQELIRCEIECACYEQQLDPFRNQGVATMEERQRRGRV